MLLIKQGGMIPLINYIAQTNILREVVSSGTAQKHLGEDLSIVQLFGGKNKQ